MFVVLIVLAAAQPAAKGWTFCIAEAGHDIFVTEVFEAGVERETLEALYSTRLRAGGIVGADVQCPAPLSEKTEAVNAQFTAITFQRSLLRKLHIEPPLSLRH